MRRLVATVVLLAAAAAAAAAPGASARSDLTRCSTPVGFTTGPFFASMVRARAVSCTFARRLVKRWGRTRDCVFPSGPTDNVCRVGRYRCTYRRLGGEGSEVSRATCKRSGTRKAVGFNFGV